MAQEKGTVGRRPRGSLSREQVMEAALRVADAEGLAEVSMARVAQEIGVAGASLYRHAEGREDLIRGLCDHALRSWEIPEPGKDPEAALWEARRSLREALRDHPGARAALAAQGLFVESRLRHLERGAAIFAAAGYSAPEAMVLAAELAPAAAALIGVEQDLLGIGEEPANGEALRRLRGRLLTLDLKTFPTLGRAADELGTATDVERTLVGSMVLAGIRERMGRAKAANGRRRAPRTRRA
jgi:TetR/AcrR family transcriptional regulator, tetracycline repressor protein